MEWRVEYMTLYMRDLEKKEEGREEGIKEGKFQRDIEMIKTYLNDGKTPQEIHDFCHYPMELIMKVKESLLQEA